MVPKLYITRTSDGSDFPLPSYTSRHHMGLNLSAAIGSPVRIAPNERILIPVGFAIGIPQGFVGQILSNPSLAEQAGLVVSDAPHLLNPADRQPIFVLLHNISSVPQILHRGDLIAQLLIIPAIQVSWQEITPRVSDQVTDVETLVVDPGVSGPTPAAADKFKSFRRHSPSIRERSQSTDSENET